MGIGIVDVGGGLRGIYAAGVFDYCLDQSIQFDLCIGVSAGSTRFCSHKCIDNHSKQDKSRKNYVKLVVTRKREYPKICVNEQVGAKGK